MNTDNEGLVYDRTISIYKVDTKGYNGLDITGFEAYSSYSATQRLIIKSICICSTENGEIRDPIKYAVEGRKNITDAWDMILQGDLLKLSVSCNFSCCADARCTYESADLSLYYIEVMLPNQNEVYSQ